MIEIARGDDYTWRWRFRGPDGQVAAEGKERLDTADGVARLRRWLASLAALGLEISGLEGAAPNRPRTDAVQAPTLADLTGEG